tara:strand:+ start:359 stop:1756 length:1398 start_codon:yes stop_codon:yes gene_type:complete
MANESMFGNIFDVASDENVGIRDRALEVAQLGRGGAGAYAAGLGGGMMMQGLAGMAGMKTQTEERKETIQNIMQSSGNLDPTDPNSSLILGNKFIQAGMVGIGQKFLDKAKTQSNKVREMKQADKRITQADTAQTSLDAYRSVTDVNADARLDFDRENTQRIQTNLETSLALTATELEEAKAQGTIVKVAVQGNSNGAMMWAQQTFDENNQPLFTPIKMQGSGEGDEVTPDSVATSMASGSQDVNSIEGLNNSGYVIADYGTSVSSTTFTDDDNRVYGNLWDLYKKDYYKAGSVYDQGSWQLSDADQEAGITKVPTFYEWAKSRGGQAASLVDRGTGGDQLLASLKAKDEVAYIKNLNESIDVKTLAKENNVSEAKLKEVPETILVNGVEETNPEGLNYGALINAAKEKGFANLVDALIAAMNPEAVAEVVEEEKETFASKVRGDYMNKRLKEKEARKKANNSGD